MDRLPAEPLQILVPATGSLAVRIRDEKGRAVSPTDLRIEIEAYRDEERTDRAEHFNTTADAAGNTVELPLLAR